MGLPVGFARPCCMSSYVWTFPVSFQSAPVCLSASGFLEKLSPRCISLQLSSWDAVANGKEWWIGFPKETMLKKELREGEASPWLFNFFWAHTSCVASFREKGSVYKGCLEQQEDAGSGSEGWKEEVGTVGELVKMRWVKDVLQRLVWVYQEQQAVSTRQPSKKMG